MNASVHDSSLVSAAPSPSERQWALAAHLAALVLALMTSWLVGVAGVIGALAVWLLKRDDSPFVAEHALEAVNFNLSMLIYACIAVAIGIALVGISIVTLGLGLLLTIPAGLALLVAVAGMGWPQLSLSVEHPPAGLSRPARLAPA